MTVTCTRCISSADSVMGFDYPGRTMWLIDLEEPVDPGAGYPMCASHAGRLSPPVGWILIDRRSPMARLFSVPA